jgi:hypothetical protein
MSAPILTISVRAPVAVTMSLARPSVTAVPICTMLIRSPSGASGGATAACVLATGSELPGERRLLQLQPEAFRDAPVRRNPIAGVQDRDIPRHQLRRGI